MSGWIDHLVIAPIVLPLVVAATMLLFDERRRWLKRALGIVTSLALLAISLLLLQLVNTPAADGGPAKPLVYRSEEHTSELQSLMRISYAVFCLKKKTNKYTK